MPIITAIKEKVEITIEFPLTKQKDVIHIQIDIGGKFVFQKESSSDNSDMDEFESSKISWFTPILCVIITVAVAITLVMLSKFLITVSNNVRLN